MRTLRYAAIFGLAAVLAAIALGRDKDAVSIVKKAAARSTLNQPGTKPFHLKAEITAGVNTPKDFDGNGTIEIWWASPEKWRREVSSSAFHQIEIVNGAADWQKNDGDYFPEWLREIAVALIDPLPASSNALKQVPDADVKHLFGITDYSWMIMSSDGTVQKGMGAAIEITDSTGLLQNASGLGWSGSYGDYKGFHNRTVARKVGCCTRVTVLEDLRNTPPDFFNASAPGGDAQPLHTLVVEELVLRKNLIPGPAPVWPPIASGPREGVLTTKVVVDRSGVVREVGTIVSDNPIVSDAAKAIIRGMRFKPYIQDGVPVQVVSRITMPFSASRPPGTENFDSARTYFERGRKIGFPAAGSGAPYILRATFKTSLQPGDVMEGQYTDTWESDTDWRREVTIGNSKFIRTRHGEKRYRLADGSEASLLAFVLKVMEPIPALDTFVESDWREKRDTVGGISTVRVARGPEGPDGILDPREASGYWFDGSGQLLQTHFRGFETLRLNFQDFHGVKVAHEIRVLDGGNLAMLIEVTSLSDATPQPDKYFELRGHEWTRAFTDEVR